jgi:hypothetical protein
MLSRFVPSLSHLSPLSPLPLLPPSLPSSLLCPQLKEQLENEEKAEREAQQHEADEELARQIQLEMQRELELQESHLLDADSRYAQEIQSNIDQRPAAVDDEEKEDGHGPTQRQQQDEQDQLLAKRLLTQSAREAYQRALSQRLLSTQDTHHMSAIANQWEDCHVKISNVMNGLCLSLLLPHLKSLKINFREKRAVVSIEAARMILPSDKTATRRNSFYSAEFEIQGSGLELTERDMSYNYSSETGLLHIYLEKVEAVGEEAGEEKRREEKGDDDEREERETRGRGGRGYWFNRANFLRIFNK